MFRFPDAFVVCGWVLGVALLSACGGDSTGPSRTPAQLAFTVQPNAVVAAGAVIDPVVQVSVLDAEGNTARFATVSITLAITSGTGVAGATLGGTLTQAAINGVATFGDLTLDRVGAGSEPSRGSLSHRTGSTAPTHGRMRRRRNREAIVPPSGCSAWEGLQVG